MPNYPVSTDYREIDAVTAKALPHTEAWKHGGIPHQQLRLAQQELADWKAGKPMVLFDTLKVALTRITNEPRTVLEVGCGVGHNSVVIQAAGNYAYTGVDYSPKMIGLARHAFTSPKGVGNLFTTMDALSLEFAPASFDIVLHSACLMHLLDWPLALGQAASIARHYLLLHRTPISRRNKMQYFIKLAYGVDCLELWFSEADLFERITTLGFELKQVWVTSSNADHAYKTYLLARKQLGGPVTGEVIPGI